MTALSPGQSPPPVSTPMRMPGAYRLSRHRLLRHDESPRRRAIGPQRRGSPVMTFSIVASDGTAWGVAVASRFLAVGAAVPAAAAGVGAIATQSYANLAYRPDGLRLLREGRTAQETLDRLTDADELRQQRQAGIVDGDGRAATFTGSECHGWAGGVAGSVDGHGGFAIQGNILTGPDVVEAMHSAWQATEPGRPLSRRLL